MERSTRAPRRVTRRSRLAYVPDAGDVVWLHFTLQAGHEQAGHRPALVLSPAAYNRRCCRTLPAQDSR